MDSNAEKSPKLLLHACCGPCSLEPVRSLRERGMEPHLFYANSNIHPPDEYARRLSTIEAWAAEAGVGLAEGRYDPAAWEAAVGKIGDAGANRQARCRACYRLRFEEAARFAVEGGFEALGTTLSVSPYQHTEIIAEELERACGRAGIRAFFEDYRPLYDEATRRSREAGMYRQNYCGCRFSNEEAALEREQRRRVRAAEREAQRAATAETRAAEEAAREERRSEQRAYDEKQARKRAVLRRLREQGKHPQSTPLGP